MSVNGENDPRILELEEEQEMRRFGGKAILTFLEKLESPIFCSSTEDTASLMNALRWGLGEEKAREYVGKWLDVEPHSVISLIRAFTGRATDMETGLQVESPFFRDQYNAIVSLADREKIATVLTGIYGEALAEPMGSLSEDDADLKLARQFMSMLKNVVEMERNGQQQVPAENAGSQ